MHPPVFFADRKELAALMDWLRLGQSAETDADEGVVVITPHLVDRTRRGVGKEVVVGILQAIELLNEKRAIVCPLHAGNIVLPRITRNLHPFDANRAACIYHANSYG